MKTHQILCKHTGEYSHTRKDPVAVYTGSGVDFEEKAACILNSDDWRPVDVPLWEVRSVELPDWLEPEDWIADTVKWKYAWGAGVDVSWPESWQRSLARLRGTESRLVCVKLLKTKNFRSPFRQSLRDQLVQWMETPEGQPRMESPYTHRQWECLMSVHTQLEAKRLDEYLYRSR